MTGNDKEDMIDHAFWARVQAPRDDPPSVVSPAASDDREVFEALDELIRYRRTIGGPDSTPPVDLTQQMSSLFRTVRPDLMPAATSGTIAGAVARASGAVRQIVANLVLDTGSLSGAMVGLRTAADSRSRQVAFVSEVADLDLELTKTEPEEDPWSVTGQLGMTTVPPEQTIWFMPAGQVPVTGELEPTEVNDAVEATVNEDGYFHVSLIAGRWVGFVEVGDAVVLFREIEI